MELRFKRINAAFFKNLKRDRFLLDERSSQEMETIASVEEVDNELVLSSEKREWRWTNSRLENILEIQ